MSTTQIYDTTDTKATEFNIQYMKNSYTSVIRVQRFKFSETMLWQLSANILKIYN